MHRREGDCSHAGPEQAPRNRRLASGVIVKCRSEHEWPWEGWHSWLPGCSRRSPPVRVGVRSRRRLAPRVVVSPVGVVHDQQDVRVALSGFGPDDRVHLSECPTASDVALAGCGKQPAQQPFLDLEHDGTGTTTFVVRTFASSGLRTPATQCTSQCVLLAAGESGLAYAPLRFAGPATLPVTGAPAGLAAVVGALLVTAGAVILRTLRLPPDADRQEQIWPV